MSQSLQVHLLPDLVTPDEMSGATVVVIDVLRATTTIAFALAAGAREVIPSADVDEARRLAAELPGNETLLGGERGGVRIEGFDLGNSPSEYREAVVGGKCVVFTTTNGTRAMQHARGAARLLLGAFVNLSAVTANLEGAETVHLLCSGTQGRITREDVLLAGAVVERLTGGEAASAWTINDSARLAAAAWRDVAARLDDVPLAAQLADSQGGRNVTRLGLAADIEAAAVVDKFDLVPRLDVETWRITSS
ncbi:MAG: 2-phosphosulfolactate phosphatase [Planctomycetota bacterium]|nr:MAG: 2-phosphosulfolactate phosphatase [Planctomycetota bacterium]REJ98654.1 MAG: 2-phosphosulfolactate phosphatase [Planctomycetota bacterium]REK22531.1 MAG: 2-phosphosulfolactate phosphatase [Planctomycetota bacterium]REK49509.1 MAG: 2-phosphosulfolactate phosphatase [Planctomycetota bacterium]